MDVERWVITGIGLKDIPAPFLPAHCILVSRLIPNVKSVEDDVLDLTRRDGWAGPSI